MCILSVKNASLVTHNDIIFDKININIHSGDCYGIIGADNQGKTSLLLCILGLCRTTSGEILLFEDIPSTKRRSFMNRVAFVPDELLTFSHMTALQLLNLTMSLQHKKDWKDASLSLLEYFGVDSNATLGNMTEDMNKCVYIISAFISMPELLILDEPFNFLPPDSTAKLKVLIDEFIKDGGTVIITGDHYSEISDICNRVSTIKDRTCVNSDFDTTRIKEMKLITATGVDESSISKKLQIVEQTDSYTKIIYDPTKNATSLNRLVNKLICDDIKIDTITADDILFKTYDWLEDII